MSFLIALFLIPAFAANTKMKYYINNAYTTIEIQKQGKVRVDAVCSKKLSKCTALQVANGKRFPASPHKGPLFGNPASSYCWDVGGKSRILKDEKNNQYDYCVFNDGSMVDAWDLYSVHYSNK
ncbi:MAG: DUF333 domain-containing protein [Bdellovibrio sp.]